MTVVLKLNSWINTTIVMIVYRIVYGHRHVSNPSGKSGKAAGGGVNLLGATNTTLVALPGVPRPRLHINSRRGDISPKDCAYVMVMTVSTIQCLASINCLVTRYETWTGRRDSRNLISDSTLGASRGNR